MIKAINKQSEKYKTVFELSPETIVILDTKGNIVDINGRIYDILGYRREEIIGKNVADMSFLPKESKDEVMKNLLNRISGKDVPPYEVEFLTKEGKKIVGRVLATLIRDKNKKIIGEVVMISDITELKQIEERLRESEGRLKNIISHSPDAIVITDLNGNIIDCNQADLDLFGFSEKKELIGRNAFDFIAKKDQQKAMENMKKTLQEGVVKNIEYFLLNKDGGEFLGELSASLIRDSSGKPVFFMAIIKDITEKKKIDQAKTEFLSLASHQFRNPLTTINLYSEILLTGRTGVLRKQQKKYLREIYDANQQLIKLVDLLLDVSRIELGTFNIKPRRINLIEIADSVINKFLLQIKDKKLKIEKDYDKKPLIINADPDALNIIFQNLIFNAIQYTPENGEAGISIKKQKSSIFIKVSDTGFGIPEAQQSQIFTKFFRADNVRKKDGTGLGLYIVKSILEQMGGKIWFESREGKGANFYVEIPLKGVEDKKAERN